MSTAKRKKRSSSLKGSLNPSKRHRDRFNIELDNLAKLLPFPHDVIQKLDKLSILRLSASYLRAKNFFKGQQLSEHGNGAKSPSRSDLSAVEGNGLYSKLLLEALDGFVIVLTQDCELFYASETVQDYLGLSQASVIHQDFLRFIHVDDHDIVKKNLEPCSEDDDEQKIKILDDENDGKNTMDSFGDETNLKGTEDLNNNKDDDSQFSTEKSFVCRMKCILNTSAGFFKPFRCTGRLREMTVAESESREYGMFLVCTPLETMTTSILEIRLRTSLFCTKNRMDLSFMDLDQKGRSLLGYHKRDIALQSSYCMIHFDDIPVLQQLHANLMGDGKCQGTFRMLNKNLKWQWLTGTAQVVFKGNEPDFIITTNRPLSDEEGEEIMRQRGQLPALTYYSDGEEESSFHLPKSPPIKRVNSSSSRAPMGNAELFVTNTSSFKHPTSWIKTSGTARVNKKRTSSSCSVPSPGGSVKSDSNRGSTSSQEGLASPLQTGSPSPDDDKSPTTCTSAPMSLPDFDLGVDLHVDLGNEEPDLFLLDTQDCDFGFDDPPLGSMGSLDDSDLASSISLLSVAKINSPVGLPTYEEALLLAQDVISNSSETSQVSPGGRSTASVTQTPPHVQCDNMVSPVQSVGNPLLYPSPTHSQVGQGMQAPPYISPNMSPSSLPTPDPSPLGQREVEQARVNISWRDSRPMQMSPQYAPPPEMSQFSPPLQPSRSPADSTLSSKSALLATMKKKETKLMASCQSSPHGHTNNMQMMWGPQGNYPYQYQENHENHENMRGAMNSNMQQPYNWNIPPNHNPNLNHIHNHNPMMSTQYMPSSVNERISQNPMQVDESGYQQQWNMHSAQTTAVPPSFEDTLPQISIGNNSQAMKRQQALNMQQVPRYGWDQPANVLSPPFQEDGKLPFRFPGNGLHKAPTTLQEW